MSLDTLIAEKAKEGLLEALREGGLLEQFTALAQVRPGHKLGPNNQFTCNLDEAVKFSGYPAEFILSHCRWRKPGREYRIPWVDVFALLDGSDVQPQRGPEGPR